MNQHTRSIRGVRLRFMLAFVVVFATYNPHGWSYLHWLLAAIRADSLVELPFVIFSGFLLVIAFSIYIQATLRALGMYGLLLALGFFTSIIWILVDTSFVAVGSLAVLLDLILSVIAAVLGTGMCWPDLQHRLTGQSDADDEE